MEALEQRGLLDRDVEELPSSRIWWSAQKDGKGLTRPEIGVLLAYAKDRAIRRSGGERPA